MSNAGFWRGVLPAITTPVTGEPGMTLLRHLRK